MTLVLIFFLDDLDLLPVFPSPLFSRSYDLIALIPPNEHKHFLDTSFQFVRIFPWRQAFSPWIYLFVSPPFSL